MKQTPRDVALIARALYVVLCYVMRCVNVGILGCSGSYSSVVTSTEQIQGCLLYL